MTSSVSVFILKVKYILLLTVQANHCLRGKALFGIPLFIMIATFNFDDYFVCDFPLFGMKLLNRMIS